MRKAQKIMKIHAITNVESNNISNCINSQRQQKVLVQKHQYSTFEKQQNCLLEFSFGTSSFKLCLNFFSFFFGNAFFQSGRCTINSFLGLF